MDLSQMHMMYGWIMNWSNGRDREWNVLSKEGVAQLWSEKLFTILTRDRNCLFVMKLHYNLYIFMNQQNFTNSEHCISKIDKHF